MTYFIGKILFANLLLFPMYLCSGIDLRAFLFFLLIMTGNKTLLCNLTFGDLLKSSFKVFCKALSMSRMFSGDLITLKDT